MTIKQIKQCEYNNSEIPKSDKFLFSGELRLKNVINEMNYFLHSAELNENKSITDFLEKVYKSTDAYDPKVYILIENLDNNHIIERKGELFKDRDKYGVYDFVVGLYPLGQELFELVDARLAVTIIHLVATETSEAVDQDEQL